MAVVTDPQRVGLDAHWEERRKLAALCRIAASLGYIGTFGHISVRVPETELVLMSPGAGSEKATVRADQIFVYDVHGNLLHHPGGDLMISEPLEHPIHTRIHRDRPEALCVAHLHAPDSTLLGMVDRPFVPVLNHAFYVDEVPTFDDPSLVVTDDHAGQLSQTLGSRVACQMRGHGSVVVGETPEIALLNCYAVEENARYQIAAEPFGGPVPFSPDVVEAVGRHRTAMREAIAGVLWAYFARQVAMTGLPL